MERISQQLVEECKELFARKSFSVQTLQDFWNDLQAMEFEVEPDWAYVFQKVYIHACLKGQREAADWLKKIFEEKSDPIQKIAYRQTYAYGTYLLQKK
jgi:hypothetical protein